MPRQLLSSRAAPAAPWAAARADADYGVSAAPDWRAVDWPAHLRSLDVDGTQINYVDIGAGDAPPVVFVHGLAGQWQNWLENIPAAAQRRRVIALDLPGFGCSEMPRGEISIPGYGRCVDAVCETLGLGEVALVGNSMGGFVAAEVAIQFPARVGRLMLVSAAGITTGNVYRYPTLTIGRIAAAMTVSTAGRHRAMAARPGSRYMALSLVARHPGRLRGDLAWEGMLKGVGKPGFAAAMRACLEYDFRQHLETISCPTLIVWGENDSVLPVRDARALASRIPDSRMVVMADTGHVPMLERPVAFNELLAEFIGEERASRPLGQMADIADLDIALVRAPNAGPFTLEGTNSWVVGSDPCWVVDPGPSLEEHVDAVAAEVARRGGAGGIALTHDHADHSGALHELRQRCGDPPVGAAGPLGSQVLAHGARFGPLTAFATPGHALDHLAFVSDGGACFSGDAVLGSGSVFITPAGGGLAAYLTGLRRLRELPLAALCPGHGPVAWEPAAKLDEYVEHRLERETRLRAALDSGLRSVDDLLDAVWDDAPPALRPAAAWTLAAHLDKLAEEGALPSDVEWPQVPNWTATL